MFLLYHSKGCNICEIILHVCYVNDLHTIICSGMLGHHRLSLITKTTHGAHALSLSKCANSLGLQVQSDVAREFSPQG
jgi:hypothetical protein